MQEIEVGGEKIQGDDEYGQGKPFVTPDGIACSNRYDECPMGCHDLYLVYGEA